jgi:hypothetical protein
MQTKVKQYAALTLLLFMSGSSHSPLQNPALQRRLDALTQQGRAYRFLDDNTLEVDNPVTGEKRSWSLIERSESDTRAWAASRGIPIIEVNPATIDTSRYTGWYRYWTTVPVANEDGGMPVVVGDANHDSLPEFYGSHGDTVLRGYDSRVYELTLGGVSTLRFNYGVERGVSMHMARLRNDSLLDVSFNYGDTAFFYKQASANTLPTVPDFRYSMFDRHGGSVQRSWITNMDNDSLLDFLHKGSDSITAGNKTFIAEWSASQNNFSRVWSAQLMPPSDGLLSGYSVGDHDSDGRMEFLASENFGRIHLVENISDKCYAETWTDSVPFVNTYYQVSGDVDNDGKPEFFIGAHMGDGSWITMFETDSDNHYSPKILFHLFTSSGANAPTYMTNDVDGDGKLELVFFTGATLYIFKANGDNNYYLWYLKRENAGRELRIFDCNNDGKKDLIIGKAAPASFVLNLYSDIYTADDIVASDGGQGSVLPRAPALLQNFPNPFNPRTRIRYSLPHASHVTIMVYDITGKLVRQLENTDREPGEHEAQWDGLNDYGGQVSSGIFFYQLKSGSNSLTRKMILIR